MDEYIKRMTDKFLCWKLPRGFSPDAGISFHPGSETTYSKPYWPTGTNLFTADQARAMFEHCADTLIEDLARKDADLHSQGRTLLDVQAQLAAAQAENERLRSALEGCVREMLEAAGNDSPDYIVDSEDYHDAIDQARAAIAGEEVKG